MILKYFVEVLFDICNGLSASACVSCCLNQIRVRKVCYWDRDRLAIEFKVFMGYNLYKVVSNKDLEDTAVSASEANTKGKPNNDTLVDPLAETSV